MQLEFSQRRQPFKTVFLTYHILSALIRLPWVACIYAFPSLRPRRSWSYKSSLAIFLIQEYTRGLAPTAGPLEVPMHLELDKSPTANGLWVESVPELVVGEVRHWAEAASVKPIKIPGYWLSKRGESLPSDWKPTGNDKVLYFMHGGAYIFMGARPSEPVSIFPRTMLKTCPSIKRSFSIEYRLSVGPPYQPQNAFPAALMDALAGYNYLVNVAGYSPTNIVIFGDSAGGNLAHALIRYLIKYPIDSLPVPGGLILTSPWVDMGGEDAGAFEPDSSYIQCFKTDYIDPTITPEHYPVRAFTGPLYKTAATNEFISPASSMLPNIKFHGFPMTFILAGEAEVLRDQIRIFAERMEKDLGDQVTYHEAKDAIHDFLGFPWFEPQRTKALRILVDWVSTLSVSPNDAHLTGNDSMDLWTNHRARL